MYIFVPSRTYVYSGSTSTFSDTEDGEITGSDSDGEVIEPEDAPKVDLFPDVKPKQPPPPQPELTPQQQARSTIPCRYYR